MRDVLSMKHLMFGKTEEYKLERSEVNDDVNTNITYVRNVISMYFSRT